MKYKVYVVGPQLGYANFLNDFELVKNISDAQIVIFTGGEDVDPSIYGSEKLPETYSNIERDLFEQEIFKLISPKQLAVGICRGLTN